MTRRSIFLVGSPTYSGLQWDENELLNESIPPFDSLDKQQHETSELFSQASLVKWRLLPGLIVPETPPNKGSSMAEAQFLGVQDFTRSHMQIIAQDDSELSQFYDYSYTVHETSELSLPAALTGESTLDSGQWTGSADTSFTTNEEGEISPVRPYIQGSVTNLQNIPSTVYLNSIMPQTMTVNLIVAVIDIRPPRRIVTRQWKRELDLVEAVVGDETRTGFGVTFWLPPSDDKESTRRRGDEAGEELRSSLGLLRPRDIVLLRMVGLSCFRDRVYGQSLRKGLTKITLLHRQQVDATDIDGVYKLRDILNHAAKNDDLPLAKVRKVHEWIRRFVPDAAGGGSKPSRAVTLPPDSQGML